MKDPKGRFFEWRDSHRLISSIYNEQGTALSELAGNAKELADLLLLDSATDDRIQSEHRGSIGISTFELVYAIPNAHVVNAAYTHPNESGGRFNDYTRGAWYAADCQEAAIAEVVYHKSRRLNDIIVPGEPDQRPQRDVSKYDDWLADFQAAFHVLDPAAQYLEFLKPEPVPQCYAASQALTRRLLNAGSNGLVYASVRYRGARCIACFRPALVYNPRRSERLEITLTANAAGYEHRVRKVSMLLKNSGPFPVGA